MEYGSNGGRVDIGKIMYAVVNKNFMGAMPLAITYPIVLMRFNF